MNTGRIIDKIVTIERQEAFSTGHVFETAIGLAPIPFSAQNFGGQSSGQHDRQQWVEMKKSWVENVPIFKPLALLNHLKGCDFGMLHSNCFVCFRK